MLPELGHLQIDCFKLLFLEQVELELVEILDRLVLELVEILDRLVQEMLASLVVEALAAVEVGPSSPQLPDNLLL
jgi:hypothetical protein